VKIEFTQSALKDLLQIHDYFLAEAGGGVAQQLIDELQSAVNSLAEFPDRGSIPKELRRISNHKFRQLIVQHYRIIYQIARNAIYINAVLDGRRDIQTLLKRRLLN
jgi:toxin ParE1/3/4